MFGIGAVASLGAVALGRWFLEKALMFLALKALLTALFIIVLPIVLNNLIHEFMQISIDHLNANANGINAYSGMLSATGFLAWLFECFKIPECIAVLVSALQLHLVLKMIPFSPVK